MNDAPPRAKAFRMAAKRHYADEQGGDKQDCQKTQSHRAPPNVDVERRGALKKWATKKGFGTGFMEGFGL
jgi:hypothetical protein